MATQNTIMRGPGRNSHLTLSFTNDSPSTWRDWLFPFYPKGKKSVVTSLQTSTGWATITPDPGRGLFVEHSTVLGNRKGSWLRGPMPDRACQNDVRLALIVLGHRFWEVSTWRVWLYRILAGLVLGSITYGVFSPLAALAALAPLAIRSPCTPRGLKMWAEAKGFVPPALQHSTEEADQGVNVLERMKAAAKGQA